MPCPHGHTFSFLQASPTWNFTALLSVADSHDPTCSLFQKAEEFLETAAQWGTTFPCLRSGHWDWCTPMTCEWNNEKDYFQATGFF